MSKEASKKPSLRLRHRGRDSQIPIYLGKLFRSFIYQNDWKLLPMSAIIAAMLSMVIRRDCFITMEGTLKGAFGITCVAIWNGCFNSIQSICRERAIIKREHRSGMHISSYIVAHMIYQALLCILQTALMLYVFSLIGLHLPDEGLMTKFFAVDLGITIFLISYASDMVSLFISSISRTTTAAMTIMPFLLIFQLVFSGGIFSLPGWANSISTFTISNYGLKCVAAQADYNNLPMVTAWNMLNRMSDEPISVTIRGEQILSLLQDESDPTISGLRSEEIISGVTVGSMVDFIASDPSAAELKEKVITPTFTMRQMMNLVGEEKVKSYVMDKTAVANKKECYEKNWRQVATYWLSISLIGLAFAALSVIVLEFIDKDKR